MNCAIGCTICAARGRRPTQTPIGTHTRLASAINMNTRNMVRQARPQTCRASLSGGAGNEVGHDAPQAEHHDDDDQRYPQQIETALWAAKAHR